MSWLSGPAAGDEFVSTNRVRLGLIPGSGTVLSGGSGRPPLTPGKLACRGLSARAATIELRGNSLRQTVISHEALDGMIRALVVDADEAGEVRLTELAREIDQNRQRLEVRASWQWRDETRGQRAPKTASVEEQLLLVQMLLQLETALAQQRTEMALVSAQFWRQAQTWT